jgi:hypothetical protein
MYRYETSNIFLKPHGHYGHGVERAKIKIISRKADQLRCLMSGGNCTKPHAAKSQVMQHSTVTLLRACELVTGVCARARSPAGQHWLLNFGGGSAELT